LRLCGQLCNTHGFSACGLSQSDTFF